MSGLRGKLVIGDVEIDSFELVDRGDPSDGATPRFTPPPSVTIEVACDPDAVCGACGERCSLFGTTYQHRDSDGTVLSSGHLCHECARLAAGHGQPVARN